MDVYEVDYQCVSAASPQSPVMEQETHPVVEANSVAAAVPQLQNSNAFAAVAQFIQSSQGQQVSRLSALGFLHISCLGRTKH